MLKGFGEACPVLPFCAAFTIPEYFALRGVPIFVFTSIFVVALLAVFIGTDG